MISVVIPLYNKEKSIASTLQSVYEQTYTDYEVVIVNDGSTDKSLDAVNEFVSRLKIEDWRLKIVSQENAGVSAARNRGILEAKGEYVAFLDADDLWAANYLETLAKLIADFPNAGLYAIGYKAIHGKEIPTDLRPIEIRERGMQNNPWNLKNGMWTGSVSASKDRIVKLGMFDTRMTYGEDLDMWWRLILDGGLALDTTCCAFYRQDTENRAMSKPIPLEKHIPYYMDRFAEARANDAEFRRYFDEQMVYRIYPYLFDKKYKKEARRLAKQLDYTQLKRTMKLRMIFPQLYRLYTGR